VKAVLFLFLLPLYVFGQDFEPPKIVERYQAPFSPIEFYNNKSADSAIVNYINKDTSLVYFIELVDRPYLLDFRVIGIKPEELSKSPDLLFHLSATNRYYIIDGKKIPVTLQLDKEFSGASWTYTGDILLVRLCKEGVQTRIFKSAKIEKYENLRIDETCQ
jgi:hypothetical protein